METKTYSTYREAAERLAELMDGDIYDGYSILRILGPRLVDAAVIEVDIPGYDHWCRILDSIGEWGGAEALARRHHAAVYARKYGDWDPIDEFWSSFLSIIPTYDADRDFVGVDVEITIGGPNIYGRLDGCGWTVWEYQKGELVSLTSEQASTLYQDARDTFEVVS